MEQTPPVLVLQLANLQNSTFYKEGTEDKPVYVNAPGLRFIPSYGVMKNPDKKVKSYVRIRYIAGCDEIRVLEQDKAGIKPNPMEDKIVFKNGDLIVIGAGRDLGLYNFLKACEWNADNPDRPEHATPIFKELRVEEKSEQVIKSVRRRAEAINLVQSLTSETEKGELMYDEESIMSLGKLFGYSGLSLPEQVEKLYEEAVTNPEGLMSSIADKKNIVRVDVAQGLELAVINMEGTHAAFSETSATFMKFKSKDQKARKEELTKFFLTPEGEDAYAEMKSKVLTAKEVALANV